MWNRVLTCKAMAWMIGVAGSTTVERSALTLPKAKGYTLDAIRNFVVEGGGNVGQNNVVWTCSDGT